MNDLFGTPLCPGAAAAKARGRGATPRIEYNNYLYEANPTGRKTLHFSYRPLQRHAVDSGQAGLSVHALACELIYKYFELVGGFRVADDRIVTSWADLLVAGGESFTPAEIRWAIAAKAASLTAGTAEERRAKGIYRGKPESFPRNVAYWLEQSPEYQQRLESQRVAAERRRMDELAALRKTVPCATALEQCVDADGLAARESARAAQRATLEAERAAFWQSLTAAQRCAARRAVRAAFRHQCENQGVNPEDPQQDGLLDAMALNWARMKWPPPAK